MVEKIDLVDAVKEREKVSSTVVLKYKFKDSKNKLVEVHRETFTKEQAQRQKDNLLKRKKAIEDYNANEELRRIRAEIKDIDDVLGDL